MIISSLNDTLLTENYTACHKRLGKALEALRDLVNSEAEDGKYVIDGEDIYASVMTYETKAESEKKFETHEKYIDIQYIVSGEEIIGSANIALLQAADGDGEDIAFYSMPDSYGRITFNAGELAIIFPGEPHAPGVALGEPSVVKKIVVKVLY